MPYAQVRISIRGSTSIKPVFQRVHVDYSYTECTVFRHVLLCLRLTHWRPVSCGFFNSFPTRSTLVFLHGGTVNNVDPFRFD